MREEAALSWPAGAARDYPGISVVHPEPRRGPGSPQTPRGGRHSLWTQTEGTIILVKTRTKSTKMNKMTSW